MQKKNRYDWNVYRKEISIRSQRRMNQVIEYVEFTSFLLQIHFLKEIEKRSAVSQNLIASLSYGTEHIIIEFAPHPQEHNVAVVGTSDRTSHERNMGDPA